MEIVVSALKGGIKGTVEGCLTVYTGYDQVVVISFNAKYLFHSENV